MKGDVYLIPTVNYAQTFQVSLGQGNYQLTIRWNGQLEGGWVFFLDNVDTGVSLIAGAPMVTGVNLLDGLDYLGIGGQLFVSTNGDPNAAPSYDNLGTDANLFYISNS